MRHRAPSLGLLLITAACSELIGLGDYEEVDSPANGGSSTNAGREGSSGSARGGSAGSAGNSPGAGGGGTAAGGGRDPGEAGAAGDPGRPGEGGAAGATPGTGGTFGGTAGTPSGGAGDDDAGAAGAAGSGVGMGGTSLGGTPNAGGGKGGAGGKSGAGGTPGTGGISATGGAGKGGAGGTSGTGGAPGKGGAGGGANGGTGGASCTQQELLLDGSFELKSPAWQEASNQALRLRWLGSDVPLTPHAGQWLIWLGGSCDDDDINCEDLEYMRQAVDVPLGTTQLRASCFWQIETLEPDLEEFDFAEVRLMSATNALLFSFADFTNVDFNADWETFTAATPTTSAYAGQRLTFEVHAELDDSYNTNFWFDSCSLVATVCP